MTVVLIMEVGYSHEALSATITADFHSCGWN